MLKQTKILTSIITMALLATQLQAGFLNFDGDFTLRGMTTSFGDNDSSVQIQSDLRLSGAKRLQDGFTVNYGLSTGEADRRVSVEESLFNNSLSVQLRELNLSYMPIEGLNITAGRQASALTTYSSLVTDPDLTFDALAVEYNTSVANGIKLGATYMFSALESFIAVDGENNKTEGAFINAFELNAGYDINSDISVAGYVSMIKSSHRDAVPGDDNNDAVVELDNTVFGLNLDYNVPAVGNASVFFEMNKNNSDAYTENTDATSYGVVLGDKVVQGLGSWKAGLELREVDVNSTDPIFIDNFYEVGAESLKSMTLTAEAGISAKSNLRFRYISSENYLSGEKIDGANQTTMLFDIVTKF